MNHRIRVPEVRLIGEDGAQLGIVPTRDALARAADQGLDLVEISAQATPPVCKILDYGKFKFEQAKKKPKKNTAGEMKEIKFRPKTEAHDLEFKTRHVREFLEAGNKVRLAVAFRGREIVHPNLGVVLLEKIVESLTDVAVVEQRPSLEGRNMAMIIAPKK